LTPPSQLVESLKAHRAAQLEERLAAGSRERRRPRHGCPWEYWSARRHDEAFDRLGGDLGDHLEVLVEVDDGQPGQFCGGSDHQVRDGGSPVVSEVGMRVTVSMVLGQLAGGQATDDLLIDYPYLERAHVLAALEYAAAIVNEREVPIARPA